MHVGTLRVRLLVREARSLKDKRQVVRSVTDRLRHQYNVSVSEVDARDQPQVIVLGVAMVGDVAGAIRTELERIQEALRRHPVAQYADGEIEVY